MEEKRFISPQILFSAISEQLAKGRQAAFVVTGMSMWPFICHGRDKVVVEAVEPDMLKKGDIILLETKFGKYILHRITKIDGNRMETTGDGNCFRDGMFEKSCVRARVVRIVRKEKIIKCDAWRWKAIFQLWMICFPVRRVLLRALRGIGKLKSYL